MFDVQTFWNMSLQMLQRSNPVDEFTDRMQALWDTLLNYNSNVKLNKYRHNLYIYQLEQMEGYIVNATPFTYTRGNKMDRRF